MATILGSNTAALAAASGSIAFNLSLISLRET